MLAERHEYFEPFLLEQTNEQFEEKNLKEVPNIKQKPAGRIGPILMVIIGFLMASFIVCRYAMISENGQKILNLKRTLEAQSRMQENLKVELASRANLNHIEGVARLTLGMDYPSNDQVKYVEFLEQKRELANVYTSQQSKTTIWDRIIELID